jgi:hypothetical protein
MFALVIIPKDVHHRRVSHDLSAMLKGVCAKGIEGSLAVPSWSADIVHFFDHIHKPVRLPALYFDLFDLLDYMVRQVVHLVIISDLKHFDMIQNDMIYEWRSYVRLCITLLVIVH